VKTSDLTRLDEILQITVIPFMMYLKYACFVQFSFVLNVKTLMLCVSVNIFGPVHRI
jgi:hypothetical protein